MFRYFFVGLTFRFLVDSTVLQANYIGAESNLLLQETAVTETENAKSQESTFNSILTTSQNFSESSKIFKNRFNHARFFYSGCSAGNDCLSLSQCAPFFKEVTVRRLFCFDVLNFFGGACCRVPNTGNRTSTLFKSESGSPPIPTRSDFLIDIIQEVEKIAHENFDQRIRLEKELLKKKVSLTSASRPEFGHFKFFKTSAQALSISRDGLLQELTAHELRDRLGNSFATSENSRLSALGTESERTCPKSPECDEKTLVYRTVDGSCNNLMDKNRGRAFTPFDRLIPNKYADGMSSPRVSVSGEPLPSARLISTANIKDEDKPDLTHTLSIMQWGQFIDHDLAFTPIFRFDNNTGIECCNEAGEFIPAIFQHPECFPIEIPENDRFFSQFGRKCMNFVRSLPSPTTDCTFGAREQMNQVTHWLDGSMIYGATQAEADNLRYLQQKALKVPTTSWSLHRGRLRTQGPNLLPPNLGETDGEEACFFEEDEAKQCFLAGDGRVNEQPQLSLIQTLWLRHHNGIAKRLQALNPSWNDEKLYQISRKIVIAQIQHITFNEWLPEVIGLEEAERSGLLPLRSGFATSYDKDMKSNIANEFSTVALRFGHTLVEGMLKLRGKFPFQERKENLFENFNRPELVFNSKEFDGLTRSLVNQPMQAFDAFVADDLQDRLFQTPTAKFGLDLLALNLQRGRDHGIPTYNDIREFCNLGRAVNFQGLTDLIPQSAVTNLQSVYTNVDDVEPWVAGVAETPAKGSILGLTFQCIVREQFLRLKFGDRFYYENSGLPNSFTLRQLNEIRKSSFSRVICDNANNVKFVQPLAFLLPNAMNQAVPCWSRIIPELDFSVFSDA